MSLEPLFAEGGFDVFRPYFVGLALEDLQSDDLDALRGAVPAELRLRYAVFERRLRAALCAVCRWEPEVAACSTPLDGEYGSSGPCGLAVCGSRSYVHRKNIAVYRAPNGVVSARYAHFATPGALTIPRLEDAVQRFADNKTRVALDLTCQSLHDDDAPHIADLVSHTPKVVVVSLAVNALTPASNGSLERLLALPHVVFVDVTANRIATHDNAAWFYELFRGRTFLKLIWVPLAFLDGDLWRQRVPHDERAGVENAHRMYYGAPPPNSDAR